MNGLYYLFPPSLFQDEFSYRYHGHLLNILRKLMILLIALEKTQMKCWSSSTWASSQKENLSFLVVVLYSPAPSPHPHQYCLPSINTSDHLWHLSCTCVDCTSAFADFLSFPKVYATQLVVRLHMESLILLLGTLKSQSWLKYGWTLDFKLFSKEKTRMFPQVKSIVGFTLAVPLKSQRFGRFPLDLLGHQAGHAALTLGKCWTLWMLGHPGLNIQWVNILVCSWWQRSKYFFIM